MAGVMKTYINGLSENANETDIKMMIFKLLLNVTFCKNLQNYSMLMKYIMKLRIAWLKKSKLLDDFNLIAKQTK